MKKLIILTFIFIYPLINIYSQDHNILLFNTKKDIEISLCPINKSYYIVLNSGTSEFIESNFLSYGSFLQRNRKCIILKDSILKYKLFLSKKFGVFEINNGCVIYKNLQFEVDSNYHGIICRTNGMGIADLLKISEINFLKAKIDKLLTNYEFELRPGMYWSYVDHELNIKENGEYEYYIFKYLISVGKWEKEGNWLKLHDADMDVTFYMAITGKNELRSLILPGDYEAHKFYKISNDPIINYRNALKVYLPKHNR